jgi:hypothetical protein
MRTLVAALGVLTLFCGFLALWFVPPLLSVGGDMDADLPLWADIWMATPLVVLLVAFCWVVGSDIANGR